MYGRRYDNPPVAGPTCNYPPETVMALGSTGPVETKVTAATIAAAITGTVMLILAWRMLR